MAAYTVGELSALLASTTEAVTSLGDKMTALTNIVDAQQARIDTIFGILNTTATTNSNTATGTNNLGLKLDRLAQEVSNLTIALGTSTVSGGTATVSATGKDKNYVAKPAMFSGNGDLSESRFFLATFINWAMHQGAVMNTWSLADSKWYRDDQKWIASVMNFLTDKARSWALPYLETLAKNGTAFNDWDTFERAFRDRFEPVDVKQAAQNALDALMQDKQTVQQYKAKFDEHAPRTGWQESVLAKNFRDGLTERVKDLMMHITHNKESLAEVYQAAHTAGERIREREQEKAAEKKGKKTLSPSSVPDPDAMDIDALKMLKGQASGKGVSPNGRTMDDWKRSLVNRCNKCGSSDHIAKNGNHERDVCNHCQKAGHRSTVCIRRFMGYPPTQKVNADVGTSPAPPVASGSGQTQGVATIDPVKVKRLEDLEARLEMLQKEHEALKASF